MITLDDFKKLDLRIATIKSAEAVQSSDKLLRLVINVGDEERQLVAGIAKSYSPGELIGKQIVVLANLEPKTLMGLESQGMLLAVNAESGPILLVPEKEVSPGAQVR